MTLSEWCDRYGISPTHPTADSVAVAVLHFYTVNDADLWRLTDYVVSTVSGPVVWLVPRLPVEPEGDPCIPPAPTWQPHLFGPTADSVAVQQEFAGEEESPHEPRPDAPGQTAFA